MKDAEGSLSAWKAIRDEGEVVAVACASSSSRRQN